MSTRFSCLVLKRGKKKQPLDHRNKKKNKTRTMHGERQVERRFVFGLLWPHISPLQMNINKELLISAACAVRAYVCMRGRRRGVPCEQAFLHLLALLLLLFRTTTCICGTSFLPPSSSSSCEEEVSLSPSPTPPHPFFVLCFVLAVCPPSVTFSCHSKG